jgi:hypothetical protein
MEIKYIIKITESQPISRIIHSKPLLATPQFIRKYINNIGTAIITNTLK